MNFDINRVAVLGSGVMGSGIAAHIAGAGIPVCLLDVLPKELTAEEKAKGLTLESSKVRNRIAQAGKDRVTNPKSRAIYDKDMGNMIKVGNFTDNMDMLKDCDWIIEVIVENLEIKKNFIKEISKYSKEGAIVTSNTSGISINEIVENMPLEFRQHFMGTHFFNPPRYMKLFELISGNDTNPELVEFMKEFGTKRLGKGVVMAKDTPGFVANRIGSHALVTAVKLTEKYGYNLAKADQLTGSIIGRPKSATFRTIDMVGIDLFVYVPNNIIDNINDKDEKDALTSPGYVQKLIDNGQLGDKTRQGFYKKIKNSKGKQTLMWDDKNQEYVELPKVKVKAVEKAKKTSNPIKTLVYGDSEENKFAWEVIKRTLLYSANNIPMIADDYRDIDKAMMWGYNWVKGPFAIWDEIGFEKSVKRMKEEGEKIPEWIEERLKKGKIKFYETNSIDSPYILLSSPKYNAIKENKGAALKYIGDGVACLEFKTKGNTVTSDVIDMINKSVKEVEDGDYKGLVVSNQAKNFSSGANLVKVNELAKAKAWDELEIMVKEFQDANMAMKYCKKPVVTGPYGMTLGGGSEMAMHGYMQVAYAETYMGLVELGVGLVPAGGGVKELLYRSSESLGKAPMSELLNHMKKAWNNIAMGKVSSSAHDAIKKGYMRDSDRIVMNSDYQIDEAKRTTVELYDNGFRPKVKRDIKVTGKTGRGFIKDAILFMKNGNFISEYDAFLADKVASILTGGDVLAGSMLSESNILELEKETFLSLCGETKTQDRIKKMITTGRRLRN